MEEMVYRIPKTGFSWRVFNARSSGTTMKVKVGFSHGVPISEEDRILRVLVLPPVRNPEEAAFREEELLKALQGVGEHFSLAEVCVNEHGDIELYFLDGVEGDNHAYMVYREGLGSEFTVSVCRENGEIVEMFTLSTTTSTTEIRKLAINHDGWWADVCTIVIDGAQPTIKITQF